MPCTIDQGALGGEANRYVFRDTGSHESGIRTPGDRIAFVVGPARRDSDGQKGEGYAKDFEFKRAYVFGRCPAIAVYSAFFEASTSKLRSRR